LGLSKLAPAFHGKLARALWEGSKGAVEEALQEAGANTAYNLIARELYDHDRSLAQGLIEAGEVGGAVGFIGNFLMALIPGRRRRVRQPGEDAAADPDALDPYAALGVSPNATDAEINAAFRRRAKDVHPDVNPSPEAAEVFATLVEARDAIRRERAA